MMANPMAKTWTKAGLVRRRLKAGKPRQKDLVLSAEEAVLQGYGLLLAARKAMLEEGITTGAEDLKAALVLMTPEKAKVSEVQVLGIPREFASLPRLHAKATQLERTEKLVPLGIAFWQRDRETDDEPTVWVQQWLVNPRAEQATREARKALEKSAGKDTQAAF